MSAVEFSRPIDVARLGAAEVRYDIAATEAERTALARRFDLLSLDRLEAQVTLRRVARGMVRMNAALSADLVQTDVVTLDPVPGRIEDDFTLLFAAEASDAGALDPEAELVEPLAGGRIDIAEAVVQQLSLAIDPYPRAVASQ
jgi:uncharacterized metal-binding protein YceD (DUF177 family)